MAKDSSRTTAGELQRKVESRGQKTLKNILSNSPYIATCCSGGFQEKFSSLIQKQSPAYSDIRHDWNFKWDWLLWSDETKKLAFSSKHSRWVWYTMLLMLWAYISVGGPGHLV